MRLITAFKDFQRTLAAVPRLLARLLYLSGRRDIAGKYRHWGLARTHGESAADNAIRHAHEEAFLECLTTPVRELEQELGKGEVSCEDVDRLQAPEQTRGGSLKHFNSLKAALSELARRPRKARPDASPRPQLVRGPRRPD